MRPRYPCLGRHDATRDGLADGGDTRRTRGHGGPHPDLQRRRHRLRRGLRPREGPHRRPQAAHPRHRGLLLLPLPSTTSTPSSSTRSNRSPSRGTSGTARPPGSPRSRPGTRCSPTTRTRRGRSPTSATGSGCTSTTRRKSPASSPNLPTALDPKLIARDTLRADVARAGGATSTTSRTRPRLARGGEPDRGSAGGNCSSGSPRPDLPNLPKLVADDLAAPHPQTFGAYPIHAQMTLAQLDELLKLQPRRAQPDGVRATRTSPSSSPAPTTTGGATASSRRAYLDRLQAFADRLAPVHNPLKAHVLYHRLALDRADGHLRQGPVPRVPEAAAAPAVHGRSGCSTRDESPAATRPT